MVSTSLVACAIALSTLIQTISSTPIINVRSRASTPTITAQSSASTAKATTGNNACALASSASAAQASTTPSVDPSIPAELAYNCLKSVPNHREPALRYINSLRTWLEFHSDIEYLQDPPEGYLYPKVDIFGGLDDIEKKVQVGSYESEYDMQMDLVKLSNSVHNGHFDISPDLASTVFAFRRERGHLVAVSADGVSVPQIYLASDLLNYDKQAEKLVAETGYKPSPVKAIDGQGVVAFLLSQSLGGASQDPDAGWNQNFFSLGRSYDSLWENPGYYPGPVTTITLTNGTNVEIQNTAVVYKSLSGLENGEDAYDAFCYWANVKDANAVASKLYLSTTAAPTVAPSAAAAATAPAPVATLDNFPYPVLKHSADSIAGYYLNSTGATDVAVLQVRDFLASNSIYYNAATWKDEFQQVLENFLAMATKDGKKKLIIDLQGNPGGYIASGTDLVAQLFPGMAPNSKANMRASLGMEIAVQVASANVSAAERTPDLTDEQILENSFVPFAYQTIVTPDLKDFPDVTSYHGPIEKHGGNFTNFFQNNYTDPLFADYRGTGITITGTGDRKGFKQPFEAANIVVLTDGFCASTCTVVSEALKNFAGVQFVTIGGRPQEGPMQAVGGVKGSQLFPFLGNVAVAVELFNSVRSQILDKIKGTIWETLDHYTLLRSKHGRVNGRNSFRIGDESETPLQFVYEAADCRLWYTPEMLYDPVFLWNRVAEVAFTDRSGKEYKSKYCVKGSTGHPTSVSGGWKKGTLGPQTPPSNARMSTEGWALEGSVVGSVRSSASSIKTAGVTEGQMSVLQKACHAYTGNAWLTQILCGVVSH